jgi:hypothetical protein
MSRRVVQVFEEVMGAETATQMLQESSSGALLYQQRMFLAPGTYRLNLVVKDIVSGNMNNYEMPLRVPNYEEEKLGSSSVILADVVEKVPTRNIGTGQFVIGTSKVRPRVTDTFKRDETLGLYVQFYNFAPDEKTQKPNGAIHYELVKNGSNEKVFDHEEEVSAVEGASATQVTVEKLLPLKKLDLQPGEYTLRMKVTDRNKNQEYIAPAATFTIT